MYESLPQADKTRARASIINFKVNSICLLNCSSPGGPNQGNPDRAIHIATPNWNRYKPDLASFDAHAAENVLHLAFIHVHGGHNGGKNQSKRFEESSGSEKGLES